MRLIVCALMSILLCVTPGLAASLESMAGQMILVGFQGDSVNDRGVRAVRQDIADGRIGGVLYLRTNVASQGAVRAINESLVAASSIVPLIALDQEGGSIERLTSAVGFEEIPSAAGIASGYSLAQATQTYARMASGLRQLGFNTNFGPVVDLNVNPNNPIIARYGRSFGSNSETVAAYAGSFIDAHHQAGVLTALKHFPGHGSSRADSHEGFVDISNTWSAEELVPFETLIGQRRVDIVMTAHLFHAGVNSTGLQLPASLSIDWIERTLREALNYDGVVISDDMEMGAIRSHYSIEQAVILAVEAGTDILLFSNTANYRTGLAREVQDILVNRANFDPRFRARIEQSYRRIVALKSRL